MWAKSQDSVSKPRVLKRRERRAEADRTKVAYQPSALPLGHTGSHNLPSLPLSVFLNPVLGHPHSSILGTGGSLWSRAQARAHTTGRADYTQVPGYTHTHTGRDDYTLQPATHTHRSRWLHTTTGYTHTHTGRDDYTLQPATEREEGRKHETMKAYSGRGSWGAGNLTSNTCSLHCHHRQLWEPF